MARHSISFTSEKKEPTLESNKAASWLRRTLYANSSLLLINALLAIGFTAFYVSQERIFYSWDWVAYQRRANMLADLFQTSPSQVPGIIGFYMTQDYNLLFCILLMPFLLIFGQGRMVYEIGLALIYVLPFALALGAVMTKLIKAPAQAVFWSTVTLTLLIPATWSHILRGYPDLGAAVLLALAIRVYFVDTQLKHLWQVILIAVLIAITILFRRHFIYPAISFYGAIGLWFVSETLQQRRQLRVALKHLFENSLKVALMGLLSGLVILVLAGGFVYGLLHTDYNSLYGSYMQPWNAVLEWFLTSYGWLIWLASGLGYFLGYRSRLLTPAANFLLLFSTLSMLIWIFIVRQISLHYLIHALLLVLPGLVILGWWVWLKTAGRKRQILLSLGGLGLALNFLLGLTSFSPGNVSVLTSMFATKEAPLYRSDYDELVRLMRYMHEIVPSGVTVTIGASSYYTLNPDMWQEVELSLYSVKNIKMDVPHDAQIDSRDSYPLLSLQQSDYVVIVEPFQYHITPEEQGVVKVIVDLFSQNRGLAQDFERLPVKFALNGGAEVSIFKRVRVTSPQTALTSLEIIQTYTKIFPGRQTGWVTLSEMHPFFSQAEKSLNNIDILQFVARPTDALTPVTFVYGKTLAAKFVVNGKITFDKVSCKGVQLRFVSLSLTGQRNVINEIVKKPADKAEFSLSSDWQSPNQLLLEVLDLDKLDLTNPCRISLELTVNR